MGRMTLGEAELPPSSRRRPCHAGAVQVAARLFQEWLMERMNARMAAATCRGEEIIVRCRPGTAAGGDAPMRAAA